MTTGFVTTLSTLVVLGFCAAASAQEEQRSDEPVTDQNAPARTGDRSDPAQALLDAHNGYRDRHCAPPLAWSAELAATAQQWADRCEHSHEPNSQVGENLAQGTNLSARTAVDGWYREVSSYDFAAPGFVSGSGHFTQVVWKGSTQLGCGSARCQEGTFVVCRYSPAGNDTGDGEFAANVSPVCK